MTKLKKFAKGRENAYRIADRMGGGRMEAISRIRKVADYFSTKDETVQLRAVKHLEDQIMIILPHPESRYRKIRREMLDLLDKARSL